MAKKINKTSMPTILVEKGDRAYPTGSFTTSTTALNLLDGQIGVLSYDIDSTARPLGQYLQAGDTSTQVKAIKIVAGTPVSQQTQFANLWEAGDNTHLESDVINRDKIYSVAVKKAANAKLDATSVSGFAAPTDNTTYIAYARLVSVRDDREFGDNDNVVHSLVAPKNFTALGTVSPTDYVLQNLAANFNKQSKLFSQSSTGGNKNLVVFGVKIGGGTGVVIGTIAPGTAIPIQVSNGVTVSYSADVPLMTALADLVNKDANITATSTIEVINLATAGAAAKVDCLIAVGLQANTSIAFDNIEQTITRVDLNLGAGFDVMPAIVKTKAYGSEGTGQGRKWKIASSDRYLTTVHTKQVQPFGDWFVEGKDYIDSSKFYASYQIEYFDDEQTLTSTEISPKVVTILFPSEVLSTFTTTVTNIATRLAAGNSAQPFIPSTDAGTGTQSANYLAQTNTILSNWLETALTSAASTFRKLGDVGSGSSYLS